ncbi:hypothetical protein GBA52_003470 [Prunus armeniaca]|nr:hypothetical protein GBA52_003470 [Prunus armeniaca]
MSLFCTLSFYDGIGEGWRGPTPSGAMNLLSWNYQGLENPWTVDCSLPWVCLGDFNEILAAHEKLGGAVRNERQMKTFRQAIDSCGLKDLGYTGPKFTWWRNGPDDIRVLLDCGLPTWEWCRMFP